MYIKFNYIKKFISLSDESSLKFIFIWFSYDEVLCSMVSGLFCCSSESFCLFLRIIKIEIKTTAAIRITMPKTIPMIKGALFRLVEGPGTESGWSNIDSVICVT